MASLRQIRSRIRSVQNTQKITRAMQMVAGAKLRRAQEQLFQARPYVDRLEGVTRRFLEATPGLTHPLLAPPKGTVPEGNCPPIALVVVTSDTGLCGAYNERILAAALEATAEPHTIVMPIGQKGVAGVRRAISTRNTGWRMPTHYDLGSKVTDHFVEELAQMFTVHFHSGIVREVRVLYTKFISALSWRPTIETLLPIASVAVDGAEPLRYLYEPAPAEIAERLLPAYLTARLRRLLLEAVTSEHSARMVAMKAATDNAADMIDSLTLVRNKVRQATITKEISEISAGAEALKG